MKMERINENTIKVHVYQEDLEKKGINFYEMLGSQEQVEDFFFSVMDEVGARDEFEGSAMLSFQVIPTQNSLEILISDKEVSPRELFGGMQDAMKANTKQNNQIPKSPSSENLFIDELIEGLAEDVAEDEDDDDPYGYMVFRFENFEDLILLSKEIQVPDLFSSLHKLEEDEKSVYLFVSINIEFLGVELSEDIMSILLEYGEETELSGDYLVEHGKTLIDQQALEEIQKVFS